MEEEGRKKEEEEGAHREKEEGEGRRRGEEEEREREDRERREAVVEDRHIFCSGLPNMLIFFVFFVVVFDFFFCFSWRNFSCK